MSFCELTDCIVLYVLCWLLCVCTYVRIGRLSVDLSDSLILGPYIVIVIVIMVICIPSLTAFNQLNVVCYDML